MRTNNNRSWTTRMPLGSRKCYQKPATWVDELHPLSILGDGHSGNTGQGGNANEDQLFWEEEGQGNVSIWDEE